MRSSALWLTRCSHRVVLARAPAAAKAFVVVVPGHLGPLRGTDLRGRLGIPPAAQVVL